MARDTKTARVDQIDFEIDGQGRRRSCSEKLLIPARTHHTVRNVGRGESRWPYGYRR
jgi:hypothetical protein